MHITTEERSFLAKNLSCQFLLQISHTVFDPFVLGQVSQQILRQGFGFE